MLKNMVSRQGIRKLFFMGKEGWECSGIAKVLVRWDDNHDVQKHFQLENGAYLRITYWISARVILFIYFGGISIHPTLASVRPCEKIIRELKRRR